MIEEKTWHVESLSKVSEGMKESKKKRMKENSRTTCCREWSVHHSVFFTANNIRGSMVRLWTVGAITNVRLAMKEYGTREFYIKQQQQYGIRTGMWSMKSKCCSLKTEHITFDDTDVVQQTQKRKNRTD